MYLKSVLIDGAIEINTSYKYCFSGGGAKQWVTEFCFSGDGAKQWVIELRWSRNFTIGKYNLIIMEYKVAKNIKFEDVLVSIQGPKVSVEALHSQWADALPTFYTYEVEEVNEHRGKSGLEVLIKWKGRNQEGAIWEVIVLQQLQCSRLKLKLMQLKKVTRSKQLQFQVFSLQKWIPTTETITIDSWTYHKSLFTLRTR